MQKAANRKTAGNGSDTHVRKAIRKGMPHSRLTGIHANMGNGKMLAGETAKNRTDKHNPAKNS